MAAAAFAVGATAWLGVLVAAPSLPTHLAALVYAAGSFVCHQIPERSFYQGAAQVPVCARCLGISAGMAAGAALWCLRGALRAQTLPIRSVLVAAALPTLLTVALEVSGVWAGSNVIRAVAGVILGLGLSCVVAWALMTPGGAGQEDAARSEAEPSGSFLGGSWRSFATLRGMAAPGAPSVRSSLNPYLVCVIAWVVPGAGHLLLGRVQKAVTFLVTLTLMFATGLWLEGRLFPFDLSQPLVALMAVAAWGIGSPYVVAELVGAGAGRVVAITYEYGNTFIIVAGLLNALVVLDAFDIAEGRK